MACASAGREHADDEADVARVRSLLFAAAVGHLWQEEQEREGRFENGRREVRAGVCRVV